MAHYKAVLFDMDGTILNTIEDLHDSLNHTLGVFDFPLVSVKETMSFVGNGARRLIEQAVPCGTSEETTERVLDYYKEYYNAHSRNKTAPYAGIPELLKELNRRGLVLAVVSNKPDATTKKLAAELFENVFAYAIGEREGIQRKPAPDMILTACREMNLQISECVYIGDSEVDIATAKAAGMDCVSVTWGFRTKEMLVSAGATVIVNTTQELLSVL